MHNQEQREKNTCLFACVQLDVSTLTQFKQDPLPRECAAHSGLYLPMSINLAQLPTDTPTGQISVPNPPSLRLSSQVKSRLHHIED